MDKKPKIRAAIDCILLIVVIILLVLGIIHGDIKRIIIYIGLIVLLIINIRSTIKR